MQEMMRTIGTTSHVRRLDNRPATDILMSALDEQPQRRHWKFDWGVRLRWERNPHFEHSRELLRASIHTTGTPANFAWYATKARSWAKDHELNWARRDFLALIRWRMCFKSSRPIPQWVRLAFWDESFTNLVSSREGFYTGVKSKTGEGALLCQLKQEVCCA